MRDPKKVFTKDGFLKYQAHLVNLSEGAFYIRNHADDLHLDDDILDVLFKIEDMAEALQNKTDFEKDEE